MNAVTTALRPTYGSSGTSGLESKLFK